MSTTLEEMHELMLAGKPEDVVHDTESCPFCNPELAKELGSVQPIPDGGGDMSKTYTETEFTAAVQEAVAASTAAADAKIEELSNELTEIKASAAKDEAVASVQADLDKAEIRVAEAENKYNELVDYLTALATEQAEEAALQARSKARLDAIKEAAPFSDEYIEANIARWVAMEDDAFEAILEDWKAVSAAARESKEEETTTEESESAALRETALSNTRTEKAPVEGHGNVFGARNRGHDIRYI